MKIPDIAPEGYYWVKFDNRWWIADLCRAWYHEGNPWEIDILERAENSFSPDQIDELGSYIAAPDQVHDLNLSTKVMRQYKILNPDKFDAELVQECKDAEESVDALMGGTDA